MNIIAATTNNDKEPKIIFLEPLEYKNQFHESQ